MRRREGALAMDARLSRESVLGLLPIDSRSGPGRILYGANRYNPAEAAGIPHRSPATRRGDPARRRQPMAVELMHFIGGKKVAGRSGLAGGVLHPANGR